MLVAKKKKISYLEDDADQIKNNVKKIRLRNEKVIESRIK